MGMTSTKIGLAVGAVFLSAVAFGNAMAAGGGTTSTGGVTTTTSMSPADQAAQVTAHMARITQASRSVRKLADAAQQGGQQDAMKSMCLSDKVNQLQQIASSATSRQSAYSSAVTAGDTDQANHHYSAMTTLRRRAEGLESEANQCVGEGKVFSGDSNVTTTIDPNIAPDPNDGNQGSGNGTGAPGTPTLPPITGSATK
jgi:hypothetical protein